MHVAEIGMVSLAALDELGEARDTEEANANHLAWQAAELDEQAEDRLADAGAILVPRRAWWDVPTGLAPLLAEAERLVAHNLLLDRRIARLEDATPLR